MTYLRIHNVSIHIHFYQNWFFNCRKDGKTLRLSFLVRCKRTYVLNNPKSMNFKISFSKITIRMFEFHWQNEQYISSKNLIAMRITFFFKGFKEKCYKFNFFEKNKKNAFLNTFSIFRQCYNFTNFYQYFTLISKNSWSNQNIFEKGFKDKMLYNSTVLNKIRKIY